MIVELTHVHIYYVHIMRRDKHSIILHGIRAFHIFYSHNEKRQTFYYLTNPHIAQT
jgi:hypothetical protein